MPERETGSLSLSSHLRPLGLSFIFGGSLQTLAAAFWGLTQSNGQAASLALCLVFLLAGTFAIAFGQGLCASEKRIKRCTGPEDQVAAAGRLLAVAGQAGLCAAGGLCLLVIQGVLLPAALNLDGALGLLLR